jgi:hypothetical protein
MAFRRFFILALYLACLDFQTEGQGITNRDFLPPYDIKIDHSANKASWDQPKKIIFSERFESPAFPPAGWSSSSLGKGWMRSGTEPAGVWLIPSHESHYAVANDDSASVSNNGSADLLVFPSIDLTQADSCRLSFQSYFDGAYGQSASVKYRLHPDSSWQVLADLDARLNWQRIILDLSEFSGSEGSTTFQLAFHADDGGNQASGWAIDMVEILTSVIPAYPSDYLIFYDGIPLDSVNLLNADLPFQFYGEDHIFGICARYSTGNSDTIMINYESRYLPPPQNLGAYLFGGHIMLIDWEIPHHIPFCEMWDQQFNFPTEFFGSEGGCESDGEYIYVCHEYSNLITKYDLEGNFVENFNIPGIPGLYDLAYNTYNGHVYGGHGMQTVYEMDFTTKTLEGQFIAPVNVRGIAFDEASDFFWANDQSSDFTAFSENGTYIYSFPVGDIGNYYGLACDSWNEEQPYLWGFSRDSTGSLLVQYDVYEGQQTGLTYDVSYLSMGNGNASGLFILPGLFENCVTLGGNLKNDVVFGFALRELLPYGWNPPGVSQYKLYEQDSIIYNGPGTAYFYGYPSTVPAIYQFETSAIYDLGEFGYPGQFAESGREGPVFLSVYSGLALDFLESWLSGSFATNHWIVDGSHWEINPNMGNPSPSATFRGMLSAGPYDETITSDWFSVDGNDSCEIAFAFDLRLYDWSPTGNQSFNVEIMNILDNSWQVIRSYHNDTSMGQYMRDTIIISSLAFGDFLKIRFHAFGDESMDVPYWTFDNIMIFRLCLPPFNFQADLHTSDSVLLTWENPYEEKSDWIQHDDGTAYTNLGFNSGPENWFDIAVRWEKLSLTDYEHYFIEEVEIMPSMSEAFYILKVWSGDSAEHLLGEAPLNAPQINQWNAIVFEEPIPVDIGKDLWIGYSCSSRGGNPFSVDDGPAINGFGNMIRLDSTWTTLLDIDPEWNYNFNIHAHLVRPSREIEAFQVYRSIDDGPFQHIATTDTNYLLWPSQTSGQEQCFKSRIICYNEPGNILVSGFSNSGCVIPVEIAEQVKLTNKVRLYPNPSQGTVSLQSDKIISKIEVFDLQGKFLWSVEAGARDVRLELSSLDNGLYIIRINQIDGVEYCKIIISQ